MTELAQGRCRRSTEIGDDRTCGPPPWAGSNAERFLGRTIGSYKVLRILGRGGLGTVFLAEHPTIASRVAVSAAPRIASIRPRRASNAGTGSELHSSPHIVPWSTSANCRTVATTRSWNISGESLAAMLTTRDARRACARRRDRGKSPKR